MMFCYTQEGSIKEKRFWTHKQWWRSWKGKQGWGRKIWISRGIKKQEYYGFQKEDTNQYLFGWSSSKV